jgi:hypothetical protein
MLGKPKLYGLEHDIADKREQTVRKFGWVVISLLLIMAVIAVQHFN